MNGAGICELALAELGVLQEGETITALQLSLFMNRLNLFLDTLGSQTDYIWYERTELFQLVAGQLEYAIGPSGDFMMTRPIKIINAMLRITQGEMPVDIPMDVISPSDYDEIGIKQIQAYPRVVGYNPTLPDGDLKFWPIPDQNYQTLFTMHMPFSPADSSADYTVAPGILEMIVLNMAVIIAPSFGVTPMPDTKLRASALKTIVINQNYSATARRVTSDLSAPGSTYSLAVPYAWGPIPS